jgi:hypothetical protein
MRAYRDGMGEQDPQVTAMLTMAGQLREAATRAGRPDVVAKVDDVILRIAEGDDADQQKGGRASDTVVRILNGLGF